MQKTGGHLAPKPLLLQLIFSLGSTAAFSCCVYLLPPLATVYRLTPDLRVVPLTLVYSPHCDSSYILCTSTEAIIVS